MPGPKALGSARGEHRASDASPATGRVLKKQPTKGTGNMKAARAALLATRHETRAEEATFVFYKYNVSGKGGLGEDELLRCFADLGFSNGRQNKTDDEMREWVKRELKRGDKKGDGKLSVGAAPDGP